MHGKPLYTFYEKAVLTQFGIKNMQITWEGSQDIGPDETVHYFSIGKQTYALMFEDYGRKGQDTAFIKEHVAIRNPNFKFVEPKAGTSNPPSYDGFHLPVPYHYCHNVTGTFTLIELEL